MSICPLGDLNRRGGATPPSCWGKGCEWWMVKEQRCAVTVVARALLGSYAVSRETRDAIATQDLGEKCEKCKGTGKVWTSQTTEEECGECGGTGRIV